MTNLAEDQVSTENEGVFDPLQPDKSLLGQSLTELLLRIYGRTPTPLEVQNWCRVVNDGASARSFVNHMVKSKQFVATKPVRVKNPAGHYFSPVVDPDLVREYFEMSSHADIEDIGGIDFHLDDMVSFWERNREFIASTPFQDQKDETNRYYYRGGPYNYGDAITLRAMIGNYRPRRVIEIGSGFSSACMLDAAEHARLNEFKLTCIEPYTTRLRSVLREDDYGRRVEIIEQGVQGISLDMFRELEENDILFIDSTHVMKTGSDVHYEIFYILPVLKPGVIVHFHDCRFPFEYSSKQIFEKNYSWNEVYAVRALLMYSERFKIIFYNSLFARRYQDLIRATCPDYLRNPGSAIWLQVQDY